MAHGLGRIKNPLTPVAAALYPVTRRIDYRTATATYKYWVQNGAWLDQGQEGTCVGHAFAHRRADPPVPIDGITHQWARQLYFDASGDSTYSQGTSAYSACRVLAERGAVSAYHWITSADEMRNTILTLGSVAVGIDWYDSMFYPYAKYSNQYLRVATESGLAGGHEVLINGANFAPSQGAPFYRIKNSWGQSWGKGGTARIKAADLEWLLFSRGGDAVLVTENP